ncbi:MAG TPA: hypothetical protein VHX38_05110 [Pseudonocardiaceae bacterium]|jgi:hypothetical protein|nr:hypothetical protein [Pseudonocardiaceae bacterium]
MAGAVVYVLGDSTVRGTGLSLDAEAAQEVAARVRSILRDDTGINEAREAVADLVTTDFASVTLENVLAAPDVFEEWRVGEALAEEHLTRAKSCSFPWPDNRSTRNPGSSGGGVDLIGFHCGERARFVLAEVKTSHQQAWPPSVVTSRSHGLRGQLSGLSAGDSRCEWAIRYLMMNGNGRPWFTDFRAALKTYLTDKLDVAIFGVLVHVSEPNQADISALSQRLCEARTDPTTVELVAIYLSAELLALIADARVVLETAA